MRNLSLRALLAVFAAAILTPTLFFAGVIAWRFVDQEQLRQESELRSVARSILTALERDLVGVEAALQALSTSPSLKRADWESFHRQAEEAKAFNQTNVVVRDLTGQQIVNTRLPFGAMLPNAPLDADRLTAQTRQPYVSDLFEGAVAGGLIFIVNAPVFAQPDRPARGEPTRERNDAGSGAAAQDAGSPDIIGFVNMSLSPDRVREAIEREKLPPGWGAGVLDRAGRFVARAPDHDAFVGRSASPRFLDQSNGKAEGFYSGVNLQGVSVRTAYVRSPRFGWMVTTSVPETLLQQPIRRTMMLLGGLAAALLAFSGMLALGFGQRIARPVQELARRAAAVGRGEIVDSGALGIDEVDRVGAELANASLSLAHERDSLETLNAVGRDLAGELDRHKLVQRVIDAATSLTGAAYGAFFERVPTAGEGPDAQPEAWRLFALSGAPLEAFTRFGMPRATGVFRPTFEGAEVVRSNDIPNDPRYGSHGGMPAGHLPVRSYLAVSVRSRAGDMLGALLFGHPEPGRFGAREERVALGIAGQAAVALDNAALFNAAQAEIVQRRAAERALAIAKTEAERVAAVREAILGQLAEGVIVADAEGRIVFVNEAAQRLHGVARLDVAPEDYSETYHLFTLDGRPHPVEDLPLSRAVRHGETSSDCRWRIRRPDGSEVLAIGSARPVLAADGSRLGSVLTLRDDTGRDAAEREQRRLNDALADRAAELNESNGELQRYAYIVSHDLRAPLVNVMGFTNELRTFKSELLAAGSKPENDPARVRVEREFDESIAFIDIAVVKMEALIAAILKLSREGRRSFRPEPIAMAAMVAGLRDALRHQIDEAGADVVVAPDLPDIVADRMAVEQIFSNLLDNAVKYLAPGRRGRIEIAGEALPGGQARYTVRDNGRGIAPRDHARVFELFRRAGRQDQPGEGIGLAHVKTVVRALGGRIEVDSALGEGTTFVVTLPRTPAPGAPRPPAPDQEPN